MVDGSWFSWEIRYGFMVDGSWFMGDAVFAVADDHR
jgi:hypothetical protein